MASAGFTPGDLLNYWDSDRERCGLVINDAIVEFNNIALDPYWLEQGKSDFAILQEDVDNYLRIAGLEPLHITGVWHSHPSNADHLSDADVSGWPSVEGIRYFVVTKNKVVEWALDDSGTPWRVTSTGPALAS